MHSVATDPKSRETIYGAAIRAAYTHDGLFLGSPSAQKKNFARSAIRSSLRLYVSQIDSMPPHQELYNHCKDQKGRHVDRENLKCPHGHFSAKVDQNDTTMRLRYDG